MDTDKNSIAKDAFLKSILYLFRETFEGSPDSGSAYLDRLCEFMKGRTEKVNWEDSWLIETVNETEWNYLRVAVRKSYENTLLTFAEIEDWNEDTLGEAIGIVSHTAYHLGAIRQMMKLATNAESSTTAVSTVVI